MDDAPAPVERDAAPNGFKVGDRVRIEGEVRRLGKEGHLIRVDAPSGMRQYFWWPRRPWWHDVWVKLCHIFKP